MSVFDPKVVIEEHGKYKRLVYVLDGVIRYGADGYGKYIWGRRRAIRYGSKLLLRYYKSQQNVPKITYTWEHLYGPGVHPPVK